MLPTPPGSAGNTPTAQIQAKLTQRRSLVFDAGTYVPPPAAPQAAYPSLLLAVSAGGLQPSYPQINSCTHSFNDRPQNDWRPSSYSNVQSLIPPYIPINDPGNLTPPNLPTVEGLRTLVPPTGIRHAELMHKLKIIPTPHNKQHLIDWIHQHFDINHAMGKMFLKSQGIKQCESSAANTLVPNASSLPGQTNASLNADSTEKLTESPGVRGQLTEVEPSPPSPSINMPEHEDNQVVSSTNGDQCPGVQGEIVEWVDAARGAASVPSTPPLIRSVATSASSSPAVPPQGLATGEAVITSSRALILELLEILQDQDQEIDIDEASPADHSTLHSTDSSPATDGSGPDDYPKSATTSGTVPFGRGIKRPFLPNRRSSETEDDDEPPRKKPGREQGPFTLDALTSTPNSVQMPCPLLELHGCQGTNTTISELLRCLQNRHRIVICKECCTQLAVPDEEKKPENVLKKHTSGGCEPRCIGRSCSGVIDDTLPHHRRTEKCPSWKALSNEVRWTFIWTLVNPGQDPPAPDFPKGVGFEHSTERRPCKQQSRARGTEICAALLRDVEAKDRRISALENDLRAANDHNAQLQQRCDEKVSNLENIVETLLERLTDKNVSIPRSLQKRLHSECPKVMSEAPITSTPRHSQMPPTPDSMPKDGDKAVLPVTPPRMQASFQRPLANSLQYCPSFELLQPPETSPNAPRDFQNAPQQSAKPVLQQSHQNTNDMGLTMTQTNDDRLRTPLVGTGGDPAFDSFVDLLDSDTWWNSVDTLGMISSS